MPAARRGRPPRPYEKQNRYLRAARIYRDLSQQEVANLTGLTHVTISHIETGRTNPRVATRRLLAWKLGFDEDEIWPPAGTKSSNKTLRRTLAELEEPT